jgi:tmRNA-binding protein
MRETAHNINNVFIKIKQQIVFLNNIFVAEFTSFNKISLKKESGKT